MPKKPSPDPPAPTGIWGIEDSSTGVAGIVHGNKRSAHREAFKLAEYKKVPVGIYIIDGDEWALYGWVKPD